MSHRLPTLVPLLLLAGVGATSAPGCAPARAPVDDDTLLFGTIGERSFAPDDPGYASSVGSHIDPWMTSAHVLVQTDEHAGMVVFSFWEGLLLDVDRRTRLLAVSHDDDPTLLDPEVGFLFGEPDLEELPPARTDQLSVQLCSGVEVPRTGDEPVIDDDGNAYWPVAPDAEQWDFDTAADEVVVDARPDEEDPDTLHIRYTTLKRGVDRSIEHAELVQGAFLLRRFAGENVDEVPPAAVGQ